MTDGFVFYGSFMKALATLPDDERLQAYDAICRYALYDEEPDCEGAALGMFYMAQAQIDANRRRRENGEKGGRPKTEEKPNDNQTETKAEPNHNQTETKAEPKEKDKVKVKEKDNNKLSFGEYGNVRMTAKEYEKLSAEFGEAKTDQAVKFLDEYIGDKGYKSKSHYLAIRRWVFDAVAEKKPTARSGTPGRFQNFQNRTDQSHKDMVAKLIAMQTGG